MKLYHPCKSVPAKKIAELEAEALKDDNCLIRLVNDDWCLSTKLQCRLFDLNLRYLENYISHNSLDKKAEVMLCELGDDDLIESYIRHNAVLLGRTIISQEFILGLFNLPDQSAWTHLVHCIREGVWLSPKVQVTMLKKSYGQDLLLRYLVPYTKYVHRIQEWRKEEIPLCEEAQLQLCNLPNAKEVVWLLKQTWNLCPKAENVIRFM